MLVEYVRVYQQEGETGVPHTVKNLPIPGFVNVILDAYNGG
jgi:hypothetical protein